MKEVIKTRWVKALRSGKYKQGKDALKTSDGKFCCLGVLCDLFTKTKDGKKFKKEWTKEASINDESMVLPYRVLTWSGITDVNPCVDGKNLSEWNDSEGKRFTGIATLIEKHL